MPTNIPTFAKFTGKRKEKYLRLLREGNYRGKAARACGVDVSLITRYRHVDPVFAQLEIDAELEACGEVENALYQAAIAGNVTACQVYLYNRNPERWRDQRYREVRNINKIELGIRPLDLTEEELLALATDKITINEIQQLRLAHLPATGTGPVDPVANSGRESG